MRLTPKEALATARALLSREGAEVALEGRTLSQDLTFFKARLAFPLEPLRVRRAGVNLFLENPNPLPLRAEGTLVLLGQRLLVRADLPAKGEARVQVVGLRPGLERGGAAGASPGGPRLPQPDPGPGPLEAEGQGEEGPQGGAHLLLGPVEDHLHLRPPELHEDLPAPPARGMGPLGLYTCTRSRRRFPARTMAATAFLSAHWERGKEAFSTLTPRNTSPSASTRATTGKPE